VAAASPAVREAIRTRVFPAAPRKEPLAAAGTVVAQGGGVVAAVIFFGSRKTSAGPDPWSAYDFFVATRGYGAFYRGLARGGRLRRRATLAAALNAVLPPNQVSIRSDDGTLHAKCAVISLRRLIRETSRRRRDHFCLGRLFQPTEVLFVEDAAVAGQLLDALVSAHVLTYDWVRPWLPPRFDVEAYCRTLLRVSLSREVRPEPPARADALFEAQRADLLPVYALLLDDLVARGELREESGGYALARPVGAGERLRLRAYFAWSLVRATVRWLKYVVTFEDWLEYILRKARRHAGTEIVLTARERRLPLVFLWPRLIRYLRDKGKAGRV
jgi:hypothetical protein